MASRNGKKPWGPARQFSPEELPWRTPGQWVELYEDMLLRMEQTELPYYVGWPFEDGELCLKAQRQISKWLKKHGHDIRTYTRSHLDGKGRTLLAQRGPDYKK